MAEDDQYYDDNLNFYEDENEFTVTSIQPGTNLLFATVAYTTVCLFIGFFFRCRKKKWRKQKQKNIQENTIVGNTINKSNSYASDYETDESSVESEGSSKAFEYFFGSHESGPNNEHHEDIASGHFYPDLSYQLYDDSANMKGNEIEGCGGIILASPKVRSPNGKSLLRNKNESVEEKVISDADIFSSPCVGQNKSDEIEMKEMTNKNTFDSDRSSKDQNKIYDNIKNNARPNDMDVCREAVDLSGEGDDTVSKEMKQINALATPWTLSSFISYFSSIVTIALISKYLSVAEMICYTYVWFIIDAAFMLPSALYSSAYKHVNNAIASDTEEGYFKAGRYIRISVIINTLLSIPISFALIFGIGYVLKMYGFGDEMVQLSFNFTIISVIHQVTSTISELIHMTIDIDGYADFNAKYTFFDAVFDICLACFVIPFLRPSLFQLGLIHYAHEILSSILYYYLTWYRWGWYDYYKEGMMSPLQFDRKDKKAFATLVKKSIPMFFDELNGELEWLITTFFASYLGNLDSAAWILLSYIWELIDVIPTNIGSAAEYRISNQLSKGNIILAQKLSNRCMCFAGVTALIGSAFLNAFRLTLIQSMVSNDQIAEMLINVVPYIVACQPFVSVFSMAGKLNQALAMYKRATIIELFITCLMLIPLSAVSTYHFGWDISGMTAALIMSYATMGAVGLAIYNNADWDKAVRKNQKIAGVVESSKLDIPEFV